MIANNPKRVFQFLGLLALAFITLKLSGVIAWPWWWLTVAMWCCSALTLVIIIISFVFALFEKE